MSVGLRLLLLLSAACGTTAVAPTPPDGSSAAAARVYSFETDALGAVPAGFSTAETNGKGAPATWRVTEGLDPHDPGRILAVDAANTGSTFNVLLLDAACPADLDLSVYVMARTGEEDQGGGLVWRAVDAANYYVARWNPLEGNVRLYTVVGGKRALLESADVEVRGRMWHRLGVRMRGDAIEVAFDGKTCLTWRDGTFPAAGRIGLWTKADASTFFDQIEVQGAAQR